MSVLDRRVLLKGIVGASASGLATPLLHAQEAPKVVARNGGASDAIKTEILVVGAGPSGVPAAIAAARNGAKVVLLEDDLVPGGAPVDMYVAGPCGNPQVGIYREMLDKLNARHNFTLNPNGRGTWFLPSSYVRVIMEMLGELPGLELMAGVRLVRVLVSEGSRNRIEGVTIQRANGATQDILARIVVDATGTAEVADKAGCPSMFGCESRTEFDEPMGPDEHNATIQECTWMFITQKVRPDAVFEIAKIRWMPNESGYGWINRKNKEDVEGFLKRGAGIYLHWGGHIVCEDTRDPVCVAKAQLDAMPTVIEKDGPTLMAFGYGMTLAPKLGIRETRRIIGDHVITVNDLVAPKWPEDVVAIGRYGIDAWGDKQAKTIKIPESGYGIPYQALLVKGMENLFVVGRAVSSTHLAQSAIRVQPIVSQMGQAAGTAAALAVAGNTNLRSIDIAQLQQNLREAGMLDGTDSV